MTIGKKNQKETIESILFRKIRTKTTRKKQRTSSGWLGVSCTVNCTLYIMLIQGNEITIGLSRKETYM